MLGVIPVSFKVEPNKQVTVLLRRARTASEKGGEAIVDVNHDGRWIRGLELLGGCDFNLARAVRPFQPKRPFEVGRIGVTYDEEANAAFFYFSMKRLATPSGIDVPDLKYSHSITPAARFGFDGEGGLIRRTHMGEVLTGRGKCRSARLSFSGRCSDRGGIGVIVGMSPNEPASPRRIAEHYRSTALSLQSQPRPPTQFSLFRQVTQDCRGPRSPNNPAAQISLRQECGHPSLNEPRCVLLSLIE